MRLLISFQSPAAFWRVTAGALLIANIFPEEVAAQSQYEFFYNNALEGEGARPPEVDNEHFMTQLGDGKGTFEQLSEFNFSFVRHTARGLERWMNVSKWGGVPVDGLATYSPDFQLYSVLRLGAINEGFLGDVRSLVRSGWRFQGLAFNRRGMGGARMSWGGENPAGTSYKGVSASYRTGRDPRIGGVFMDEASILGGISWGNFSISTVAMRSESGLRSYATHEAFELSDDRFYNPSWGWYGGKHRSSNAINNHSINMLAMWSQAFGKSEFRVSASGRFGQTARTGLSWFDAAVPYPDYYRYMPDYDPVNSADPWMIGDQRITQIFWEHLVEQNKNRPEKAAYIVEARAENIRDFSLSAGGETKLADDWSISYSIDFQNDTRRRFKRVESLLGANSFIDVDQFLVDDEIFGGQHYNDAKNPDRLIGKGDRFGYNYRITAQNVTAKGSINYRKQGLNLLFGLRAGTHTILRRGFYEKEIFPDELSFGKSKSYTFSPWGVTGALKYAFSPRYFLDLNAEISQKAPYADNIFVNPEYSNITISSPEPIVVLSSDLAFTALWDRFGLKLSTFFVSINNESAVYRYWDDIAGAYADMAVNQIDKRFMGVEIGVDWEISSRFSFKAGGSVGSYTYSSDAQAVITDDASRETIADEAYVRLKKYRLATSPESMATAEISYDTWGWIASLSASYAGGRYVAISPLRRMQRAYGLAGSPERHNEFIMQEKLDDAFSLNLFIMRSFELSRGRLVTTVSLNNLLDTKNIYHGYEQMHLQKSGEAPSQSWNPFPSKYLYGYGRTYYISATYSF